MAFADFDQLVLGNVTAEPIAHQTLASPLAGRTDFGRYYTFTNTGGGAISTTYKTTANGGLYNAVPSTKAISLRAYVRFLRTATSPTLISLNPKKAASTSCTGYFIGIGDYKDGSSSIATAGVYVGYRTTAGATISGKLDTLLVARAVSLWTQIRIDVTPVTGGDRIQGFYRFPESMAEGDWVAAFDETVLTTDTNYIAWGGTNRIGWWWGAPSSVGGAQQFGFIDDFDVRIKDV